MNTVVLLLGTNLGNKLDNINIAFSKIEKSIGIIEKKSEILETEPWGFESKNSFLNVAIKLNTHLSPIFLLKSTQIIENEMGRDAKISHNYEDRLIDIDIMYFGKLNFYTKILHIPHYLHTNEREFSINLHNSLI